MQFDYIVIGAGSGGVASANRAAMLGAKVLLIENNLVGGTCVNVGCVPKKVMWQAAEFASVMHHARDYGFNVSNKGFNWHTLVTKRQAYIERLHGYYQNYLNKNQVEYISGAAQFVDHKTVSVNGQTFSARHILIATGSTPSVPDVDCAELGITSDGFFELTEQPKKVAVVGAGYIAVELAGILNALGTETTLVLRRDKPLRNFDVMLSEKVLENMVGAGVEVKVSHVPVKLERDCHAAKSAPRNDNAVGNLVLHCQDQEPLSRFDQVIWATGRSPNISQLNLEATGIEVCDRGFIAIDEFQNTNVGGVYAVGDVTNRPALTPVAIKAGRMLSRRLFGGEHNLKLDYDFVPTVMFSHPPLGTIGLTEAQAEQQYGKENIKIYQSSFTPMLYAITDQLVRSHFKLIVTGDQEKVIGCHIVGYAVDEILQGFAVAMQMGATKADFDNTIAIHPTSAEELVTMT